ncbi:MAG: class II fructose-bisphosphatase [Candidatus Sericytochromatia bacterium]|nr:class II fructose-bisphosphatase [Candidatus Sericytochromatia bacterium]
MFNPQASGEKQSLVNVGMERALALDVVQVVESAALGASRLMGRGDRDGADHEAVEAMRLAFNNLDIDGTIVIGEGERDEAPMLYIGEKVGRGGPGAFHVDIAVDPLEGTNLVATGANNSIAVMAMAEAGGLLHAPDTYMEKLIVGPSAAGKVDIKAPVRSNLAIIAMSLNREISDLTVVILDRPRHEELMAQVREAGARIRLIGDGDVTGGLAAAIAGSGVHAVMGIGGAPEGVLTAAAMRCLGGEIQAIIRPRNEIEADRARAMGIDLDKVYSTVDLAPGKEILFAATGITDGEILKGVRFFGAGARTYSIVMGASTRFVRFIDTVHMADTPRTTPIRLERY